MDSFTPLFQAIERNATAALLVLALLAIAYLAKALIGSYETREKLIQDAHAKHLETAMQVAPLAREMVKTVEVLERLTDRATGAA